MKLLHHCDESNFIISNISVDVDRELHLSSEKLRLYEDKFFKIFNLNPVPMSIADINSGVIIDVNDAFLEALEVKNINEILGHSTIEKNIISNKSRKHIIEMIEEKGFIRNFCCEFNTIHGKKKIGIFSGAIIELCNKTCLILMCQVVNKKFFTSIFKTFFTL